MTTYKDAFGIGGSFLGDVAFCLERCALLGIFSGTRAHKMVHLNFIYNVLRGVARYIYVLKV